MELAVGQYYKIYRVEAVKPGGMGTVYLCTSHPERGTRLRAGEENTTGPHEEEWYALKSVSSDFYVKGDNGERFDLEALIWTSLPPHPHIVTCVSVERMGNAPMIILEYAAGGTLRDRMRRGRLPLALAMAVFRQVCSAMDFLSQVGGIYHRDIKPENILFGANGGVKVTDFGLASLQRYGLGALDGPQAPTGSRTLGGTLPYMSPEHFGIGDFTSASDVYSFGAVMFEVLEGRSMFTGSTVAEIRHAHTHGARPVLSRRGGPPALAAIVGRCVEVNPAQRYRSFRELDAALVSVIVREGLAVPEPTVLTVEDAESRMNDKDWNRRGYAFARLNRFDESLRCYQRAYALDPSGLGNSSNVGTGLVRAGRMQEALSYFEEEVRHHPEVPLTHLVLGQTYERLSRVEDAEREYTLALEGDPEDVAFLRNLCRFYSGIPGRRHDFDRLVGRHVAAMTKPENNDVLSWVNEGIQFGLMREYETSLRMLDECIARFPSHVDGWHNRAVTLFMLQRMDEAASAATHVLELNRDSPQTLYLLGIVLAGNGEFEAAAQAWTTLVQRLPDHSYARRVAAAMSVSRAIQRDPFELVLSNTVIPDGLYYRA